MLNILVNAYSVSPTWGSEPGVGWNWIIEIAKHNKVFVITEGEWKDEIEAYVSKLAYRDNIKFYFCPVSQKVRNMCWNQGNWYFYVEYNKWQKRVYKIAKQILASERIDLIHHLNMVTFREPGYLWKFDKPFVWGPISGCSMDQLNFLSGKAKAKGTIKNLINWVQIRLDNRVRRAVKKSSLIITPKKDTQKTFKIVFGVDTLLLQETGIKGNIPILRKPTSEYGDLNILWVGRFIETKKLDIAIMTIKLLSDAGIKNVKLHVVGFGLNDEERKYREMVENLGINEFVVWHGKQPNDKVQTLMQEMDLFLFTSISEVTSTVVLESLQNHLPVLCHDACGFGSVITNSVGRKIPLVSPRRSVIDFAESIKELNDKRYLLDEMQHNFDEVVSKLTYEYKGELMTKIYQDIVKKKYYLNTNI